MMSLRPPEITTPVPTGAESAPPALGTFGSLLSCTEFFVNSQQLCEPVGPVPPPGHAPFCGDGASAGAASPCGGIHDRRAYKPIARSFSTLTQVPSSDGPAEI